MDAKLAKICYSPGGYWKGITAIKKLSEADKVPEETAKKVADQASALADLPPHAEAHSSAETRRAHTQRGPSGGPSLSAHDKPPCGRKVYKYALTVVDVASRYKEAGHLTSKNSNEGALAFKIIYKRAPLIWPQLLQVDPGRQLMGAVTKEMENHKTYIRRERVDIHRDQAIVERFNCTLAERSFGQQYAVEM